MKHFIRFSGTKAILGVILLAGLSSVTRVTAQTGNDDKYHDKGVTINGVTWATRNVDMPGTFAATPESPGMWYHWGSRVGWRGDKDQLVNSNGGTKWVDLTSTGEVWEPVNDPCPDGWRVPTDKEWFALILRSGTKWVRGDNGAWSLAGPTAIFFPAGGFATTNARTGTGKIVARGRVGGYWRDCGVWTAIDMHPVEEQPDYHNGILIEPYRIHPDRPEACSIRCVRK
jgi:hypothetical protein